MFSGKDKKRDTAIFRKGKKNKTLAIYKGYIGRLVDSSSENVVSKLSGNLWRILSNSVTLKCKTQANCINVLKDIFYSSDKWTFFSIYFY